MADNTQLTKPDAAKAAADQSPAGPTPYKGMVRALARGYYGGNLRDPQEEFHYEGILGSWMEPIDKKK